MEKILGDLTNSPLFISFEIILMAYMVFPLLLLVIKTVKEFIKFISDHAIIACK